MCDALPPLHEALVLIRAPTRVVHPMDVRRIYYSYFVPNINGDVRRFISGDEVRDYVGS